MMKKIKIILIVLTMMLSLNQLISQTIINNDSAINNRAYLRIGIEPATMLTFGYERKIELGFMKQNLVAYAEYGSSIANFSNNEIKLGGILPVFEKGNFKIVNNLNFSAGSLSAKNFKSQKFAVADEIAFGLYKPKWFMALTAEYEKIYLNHTEHTNFYRETYYEDVVDGWYKGAGGMFQFGIEGGYTFIDRLDAHVELKFPVTEKFNSYGGSPMHVNLGIGYRF